MFSVKEKYQSSLGKVRFSQAMAGARFGSETKGLALKYVAQGTEHYEINQQYISVQAGQLLILPQDNKFAAFTDNHQGKASGICIDLDTDFVQGIIPDVVNLDLLFFVPFQGEGFLALTQSLKYFSKHGFDEKLKDIHLETWCADLQQLASMVHLLDSGLTKETKKLSTQRCLLVKLFRAKNYIHHHYRQRISLSLLSRHVGISSFYFARLFQACFQQSPQQLQVALRMQAAVVLLQEHKRSLSDIAYTLGYCDLASFSNQFKQHYQESPSLWRKTHCL